MKMADHARHSPARTLNTAKEGGDNINVIKSLRRKCSVITVPPENRGGKTVSSAFSRVKIHYEMCVVCIYTGSRVTL